jgi:nucleoside-diphosphate-sugar epimerase
VLEVVKIVLEVMGKPSLEPIILNEASREIPSQFLDCSKARRVLGWKARYDFESGLAETLPWYQSRILRKSPQPGHEPA